MTRYRTGQEPRLYEFLSQQPKDVLIASLSEEANFLPPLAERSILVGSKYAIPYQTGYYRQVRQRAMDLLRAQYTQDLGEAQRFIRAYRVDLWLIRRSAFGSRYVETNPWLMQFQPVASEIVTRLEQGDVPALAHLIEPCSAFATPSLVVLRAECILAAPKVQAAPRP